MTGQSSGDEEEKNSTEAARESIEKLDDNAKKQLGKQIAKDTRRLWNFVVSLLAGFSSTIGGILLAPQLNSFFDEKVTTHWWLFGIGCSMVFLGLIVLPVYLYRYKTHESEFGRSRRFVARVDGCIRALAEFAASKQTHLDKTRLLERITTEAVSTIGMQVRICVYRRKTDEKDEISFELEYVNPGDRSPRVEARPSFDLSTKVGERFIELVDELTVRFFVKNSSKAPKFYPELEPSPAADYRCFIVSPLKSPNLELGVRRVRGAVTFDFPSIVTYNSELDALIAAWSEMLAEALVATHSTFGDKSGKKQVGLSLGKINEFVEEGNNDE